MRQSLGQRQYFLLGHWGECLLWALSELCLPSSGCWGCWVSAGWGQSWFLVLRTGDRAEKASDCITWALLLPAAQHRVPFVPNVLQQRRLKSQFI